MTMIKISSTRSTLTRYYFTCQDFPPFPCILVSLINGSFQSSRFWTAGQLQLMRHVNDSPTFNGDNADILLWWRHMGWEGFHPNCPFPHSSCNSWRIDICIWRTGYMHRPNSWLQLFQHEWGVPGPGSSPPIYLPYKRSLQWQCCVDHIPILKPHVLKKWCSVILGSEVPAFCYVATVMCPVFPKIVCTCGHFGLTPLVLVERITGGWVLSEQCWFRALWGNQEFFCYVANVCVPVFPKIVHILHQLITSLSGERGRGLVKRLCEGFIRTMLIRSFVGESGVLLHVAIVCFLVFPKTVRTCISWFALFLMKGR